jgi:hypothetical protein
MTTTNASGSGSGDDASAEESIVSVVVAFLFVMHKTTRVVGYYYTLQAAL